jgi:hypothetical protein
MALAACCYQVVHKGTNLAQSKWKVIRHDREVRPHSIGQLDLAGTTLALQQGTALAVS